MDIKDLEKASKSIEYKFSDLRTFLIKESYINCKTHKQKSTNYRQFPAAYAKMEVSLL